MGVFSGIRVWLEKLKEIAFIYSLLRLTPEQLSMFAAEMVLKHAKDRQWSVLNYATGHALTGWALMEDCLVILASLLLNTTVEKTGLVFFSIINFQAWITIITELFELDQKFSPFQRRWNKIFERLRSEKDNRDRLAHNYIMSENASGNPLGLPIKIASRIDMRQKSLKSRPMTLEQVVSFRTRVDAIADDLQSLIKDMTSHLLDPQPASPEKSSELSSDQPT